MLLLPQRNPVYVAKEVSSLDWLSGGRVDLGIGVGWLKEEFDALNVPWERRGRRTDEYLEVLRTLWVDDTSSFHGEIYDLPPCEMYPKPVQQPHPPLHIGGETPAALRRAARLGAGLAHLQPVARASWPTAWPSSTGTSRPRGGAETTCASPSAPTSSSSRPTWVEQYAEAGADAVAALFFAFSPDDVAPGLRRPRGLPGGGGARTER